MLFSQQTEITYSDKVYGPDQMLYNGRKYSYNPPPASGHQFLRKKAFSYGSVTIKGKTYENILLNYDILNQKLLLKYSDPAGAAAIIELSDGWVEAFSIDTLNFIFSDAGKIHTYFQVLGNGHVKIFYQWWKTLNISGSVTTSGYSFSDPVKMMFLSYDGKLMSFNSRGSLIKLFPPDIRNKIKTYLHKNNIRPGKASDRKMTDLANFAGSLISTGKANQQVIPSVKSQDSLIHKVVKIPEKLPSYELANVPPPDTVSKKHDSLSRNYLQGRKPEALKIIRIGRKGSARPGETVMIRGRIIDQTTGQPLPGATFFINETKTGAATGSDGHFSLKIKPGSYTARIAFMGMNTLNCQVEIFSGGEFTAALEKSSIQMSEVEVLGDRQMDFQRKMPGLEKITVKEIHDIPVLMGERDILKISEMMPGIVTIGEGTSGLNVRGGNFDQNGFFIKGIPIYNTSHLFGFFSVFNADIIRDFSIYKGYIPAEFGGQISSVFDINARQGNRRHFTAHGGISPVAANLSIEGPLKKDKGSFLVSGRYLYSDWILGLIHDPLIRSSSAGFNDFSAALNHDFKKAQVSLFLYHSQDKFLLSDLNSYHYSNNGAGLTVSQSLSPSLRSEYSFIFSQFAYTTTDLQEPPSGYKHSYNINDYRIKASFNKAFNQKTNMQYGGGITFYQLKRGTVMPFGEESLRVPLELGNEQGMESSLFVSGSHSFGNLLDVSLGARINLFTPMGPANVYEYYEGGPKDLRYVKDTLHFGNFEPEKWYLEPDIRGAVILHTDKNGTVKFTLTRIHQNIFMLNNTVALAPNAQWKLADYNIPPITSDQVSAGVFRTLPNQKWEGSAEVWYKKSKNIPQFIDAANFLSTPQTETILLPGKQNAWGIELMVRKKGTTLEGWISYTWSRSKITVNGTEAWEQINNGLTYPADYDIPNVLNSIIILHLSRRITTSGVVSYQTGRPITYPVSVYYVNGTPVTDYSKRNEFRIPDYFRIDLSVTVEGNLKKKKFLHSSFIFNLYNVLGRENPYSVFFRSEDGKIKSYKYSVIGTQIFTITWLFKLGNYAAD